MEPLGTLLRCDGGFWVYVYRINDAFLHKWWVTQKGGCYLLYFYRVSSYASAILAVVIRSVPLSHTCCFVKKPDNALQIFWYRTNGQSLSVSLTDGADLRSKGQSRSHRHSAEMGNVPQLTNRSVHHIKHHKRHTYRNAKVTKSTYICPSACATWAYNNNEMTSCIQTLASVRCEYFQAQNPSSRPMFGGCDRIFVNGFQIGTMEPKVMKVEYASGQ